MNIIYKKWIFKLLVLICCAFVLVPTVSVYAEDNSIISTNVPLMKSKEMGFSLNVPLFWNDSWFFRDAREYNQELAVAEIVLSSLAYIDKEPVEITKALVSLGFDEASIYVDYTNPTLLNNDIASFTIAKKIISDGNSDTTLVAIVIKGTSGNEEWVSNLNIGEDNDKHLGFSLASIRTYLALTKFLQDNSIEVEKAKFLVTGHSRGAGVANILAATVQKELKVSPDNLFAYTFAAPRTTKESDTEGYNIFNLVSSEDMVTILPFGQWGYRRYGKDLVLPGRSFIEPEKMEELSTKVDTAVFSMMGMHFYSKTSVSAGLITPMTTTEKLVSLVPNVATFNLLLSKSNFSFGDYFSDEEDNSDAMMLGLIGALTGEDTSVSEPVDMPSREDIQNGNVDVSSMGAMTAHASVNYYAWLAATTKEELFGEALNSKEFLFDRVIVSNPGTFSLKDKDDKLVFSLYRDAILMSKLAVMVEDDKLYMDFPGGISDYYLKELQEECSDKKIEVISYKLVGADVQELSRAVYNSSENASESVADNNSDTVPDENIGEPTDKDNDESSQADSTGETVDKDSEKADLVLPIVITVSGIFIIGLILLAVLKNKSKNR